MISKFDYFSSEVYREENSQFIESGIRAIDRSNEATCQEGLLLQTPELGQENELKSLVEHLTNQSTSILNDQGYRVELYNYRAFLWGQKLLKGAGHLAHVHANSQVSALYFLRTPEHGAFPVFEDPRNGKKMGEILQNPSEEIKSSTPEIHFNNVVPGTILYFNSWLPHKIVQNRSEEPTYFLHFILKANEAY